MRNKAWFYQKWISESHNYLLGRYNGESTCHTMRWIIYMMVHHKRDWPFLINRPLACLCATARRLTEDVDINRQVPLLHSIITSIFCLVVSRLFNTGTSAQLIQLSPLDPNSMIIHLTDQPLQECENVSYASVFVRWLLQDDSCPWLSLDPLFLEEESAGMGSFIPNVWLPNW